MFHLSSCSCLCPIHWSQVLSREWRYNWSSADRRCSNYIWVVNSFMAYLIAPYIRGLTVKLFPSGGNELNWPFCAPLSFLVKVMERSGGLVTKDKQFISHYCGIKLPFYECLEDLTVASHESHGASNHCQLYCLFNRLFRMTSSVS